jgi:hypothetical protein
MINGFDLLVMAFTTVPIDNEWWLKATHVGFLGVITF